ncbi:MAG: hypothetical protein LBU94_03735 [Clostridiales bacterium]|jgi:hypothetical protein|nr:hypothetical protein [Clostridiales bacterium]
MTKKEELYCLMSLYKKGRYDIATFCDELTRILYYENNAINELVGHEREAFETLGNVANRYSPYEDDRNASKWYCDEEEVKKAIELAYSELDHG